MRSRFVLVAVCTLLGSLILLITKPALASTNTDITLSSQEIPPKADVSPGSAGIVTMRGEVSCKKYGPDPVNVFLKGSLDFGSASVVPSKFVFSGSNGTRSTDTFGVTTRVPMGYSSMATPQVTISGYFVQSGLNYKIPPVTQIIEIEPYYDIEVDPPPPQEIGAGDFVYFPIKITNVGNTEDTYEFCLLNLIDLCSEQWTIATITPKTFMEGETRTITVRVQAPQTQTNERNTVTPFNLRILSQQSFEEGGIVRYDVPLLIYQKGFYISGFSPAFALTGVVMVALVMGRRRLSKRKPNFLFGQSKDLYGKLSMNMR